jgi:hypothetical protein
MNRKKHPEVIVTARKWRADCAAHGGSSAAAVFFRIFGSPAKSDRQSVLHRLRSAKGRPGTRQ